MARLKALESLLLKMFSAEELRRLIRYLPEGDTLSGALPGLHASPVMVAEAVVGVLDRDGALNEATVWDRFYEARPRRRAEIDVVRAMFPPEPQPAKASSGVLPAASLPAPDKPKVLTILFASASPAEKDRMRVDKEFRRIVEKLRGSRHRDRLRVVTITAVRFEDLRTGLMEHEPHILHISCHGNPDGSLAFEASDGDAAQVVPKKNLLRLLRALGLDPADRRFQRLSLRRNRCRHPADGRAEHRDERRDPRHGVGRVLDRILRGACVRADGGRRHSRRHSRASTRRTRYRACSLRAMPMPPSCVSSR
jgi:hypothetical protein